MNKFDIAVKDAKIILRKRNRDAGHDLKHHESVWKNCQLIIKKEKLEVDSGILKVAAFWHDVVFETPSKESVQDVVRVCKYLTKFLPSVGFKNDEVNDVIQAVRYHEYGSKPETMEGFIVQDADKLEVLSIERWNRAYSAYEKGKLSKEKLTYYIITGLSWIPMLENAMHFESSKILIREKIGKIIKSGFFEKFVKEFGVEKEYIEMLNNLSASRR